MQIPHREVGAVGPPSGARAVYNVRRDWTDSRTKANETPMKTTRFLLSTTLCLGLVACDKGEQPAANENQEEEAPQIKVQLPPPPDFDEGKAPETWEDGSNSIYGLRRNLDQNVEDGEKGKDIIVKGYVQEIYVAPECPAGEVCPPPKQAHVWITDSPEEMGKKRAMMVVNYRFTIPEWDAKRWKDQPDVILEKGKRYTFKGKFKQFSNTGFAFDRGLLDFVAYKPHDPETGQEIDTWVYPPGADWHPVQVAYQEEQNAKLAEKAKASAVEQ